MIAACVQIRKALLSALNDLGVVAAEFRGLPIVVQVLFYVVLSFNRAGLRISVIIASIPLHLTWSPQQGFEKLSSRSPSGEFLESYTGLLGEHRRAVGSVVLVLLIAGLELTSLGFGLRELGRPQLVQAVSATVDLNPSWDDGGRNSVLYNDDGLGGCTSADNGDICQGPTAIIITIGRDVNPPTNCTNIIDSEVLRYRGALKFSTTTIPDNATITNVQLIVNVNNSTDQTVTIFRMTTDTPDTLSCTTTPTLYSTLGSGTNYTTATWSTTGQKTVSLGATAISDVQTRITGSDLIAIGLRTAENSNNNGIIDSVNHGTAANRPILRVSYTTPPPAPTNVTHSSNTTSSISWSWTDNATTETRYDVHDGSHANVAGCTNVAANSTSCTETGLSANTPYTRHANVTDAQGNTDSSSASAYSSIETPSGIIFGTIGATSIATSASGTLSNLSSGSSGLFFQESVTSTNSGWTQTNSWTKSGLTANTQYSFQAKARNGDSDETALTSAATTYTLSAAPNVTSTRSTSTWYTSGTFNVTNAAGWGGGGVQYYRYAWKQGSTHTFDGTESTWSNAQASCPGGSCTDAGTTLAKTASANGNTWYLHVQAFNGDGTANGTAAAGPFFFNSAAPSISDNQSGDTTPRRTSGTTYDVDFAKSASGPSLDYAQYAVYSGASQTGTRLKDWTNIFTTDVDSYTTDWTVDFASLPEGTNYVSVRAFALDGLSSEAVDAFTILKDTVGPTVSEFKASTTTSTATLSWTTNESATTQLEWGTTTSYGNTTTLDSSLVASHSVKLEGLASNTTFHARTLSTDAAGNSSASSDLSFTTQSAAATVITNVQVTKNSPTSVTVTWTTNEPATSKVRYGLTTDYGLEVADLALTTLHRLVITDLTPNSTYHYEVISTGSTTDNDADATFTTPPEAATGHAIPPTLLTPAISDGLQPTLTVTGVAKGGQTVKIYVDGKVIKTLMLRGTAKQTKPFSVVVDLTTYSVGTHTIYAQTIDDQGRTSEIKQRLTVKIGGTKAKPIVRVKKKIQYTVQGGDSLWRLADRYLGDGSAYQRIIDANVGRFPTLQRNPSLILPGWTLTIPPG